MLGVADPRTIYNEDAELLALWAAYLQKKRALENPQENTPPLDLDQHVAMCDRLLG